MVCRVKTNINFDITLHISCPTLFPSLLNVEVTFARLRRRKLCSHQNTADISTPACIFARVLPSFFLFKYLTPCCLSRLTTWRVSFSRFPVSVFFTVSLSPSPIHVLGPTSLSLHSHPSLPWAFSLSLPRPGSSLPFLPFSMTAGTLPSYPRTATTFAFEQRGK